MVLDQPLRSANKDLDSTLTKLAEVSCPSQCQRGPTVEGNFVRISFSPFRLQSLRRHATETLPSLDGC